MKWLRLPQEDSTVIFVTTTSVQAVRVAKNLNGREVDYTEIVLTCGRRVFIDIKYTPMQVLKAIENEQDMFVSPEIIDIDILES